MQLIMQREAISKWNRNLLQRSGAEKETEFKLLYIRSVAIFHIFHLNFYVRVCFILCHFYANFLRQSCMCD